MGPYNGPYPHAYRYRDWVIQAVNSDLPYDEFLLKQLASDLLPDPSLEDLAALGMIGLSPQYHKELKLAQIALESVHADEWEDRVDLVTRGLMGLTVACARCHDHKYDPVTTKDYYALAGVFASLRQAPRPILSEELIAESQPARDTVQRLEQEIKKFEDELKTLRKKPAGETDATEREKRIGIVTASIAAKKNEAEQIRTATPNFHLPMVDAVTEEQVRFEPDTSATQKFAFYPNQPRDLPVFIRGNVTSPGEIVPRRFLEVLSSGPPTPFGQQSGRLELANAIASTENPLTARVFVNRVWQRYFGEGLVDTPSNFGVTGSAPSHPELLDDLAVRFMKNGWSLKWLHREILYSAAYQQSSRVSSPVAEKLDPANRLIWKFNRRRQDAESLHDSLLQAAGNLDLTIGGPSSSIDTPTFNRRAVYATISRNAPSEYLQMNDFPDPTIHAEQRSLTTTPLQQLFVLNSPFVRGQAVSLAEKADAQDLNDRVRMAYRSALSREPTTEECAIAANFLQSNADEAPPTDLPFTSFTGDRMKVSMTPEERGDVFTFEFWFRNTVPYQERPVTGYLVSLGKDGSSTAEGDHLGIGGASSSKSTGRLFFFNGNRLRASLAGKSVLTIDDWHHVVLVRQGKQVHVYLDGSTEPEISGEVQTSVPVGNSDLFFAGRNDRFANFRGEMLGIAVYQRALSTQEIAEHYRAGQSTKGPPDHQSITGAVMQSAPHFYWPLAGQAVTGSRFKELSSRANHAVLEGKGANAKQSLTPWQLYCHAILCSNELLFID